MQAEQTACGYMWAHMHAVSMQAWLETCKTWDSLSVWVRRCIQKSGTKWVCKSWVHAHFLMVANILEAGSQAIPVTEQWTRRRKGWATWNSCIDRGTGRKTIKASPGQTGAHPTISISAALITDLSLPPTSSPTKYPGIQEVLNISWLTNKWMKKQAKKKKVISYI